jgi:hypothetical protein
MNENKFIFISKLDAAKRQLELAIILFFNYFDVVAIHTLTNASHEILKDLGENQGVSSIIKDLGYIREDKRREYRNLVNAARNFFKHADTDPNKTIKFNPVQTEYLLFDACKMYKSLASEDPQIMSLYKFWFYTKNPHILIEPEKREAASTINEAGLDPSNRMKYLELLPDIMKPRGI